MQLSGNNHQPEAFCGTLVDLRRGDRAILDRIDLPGEDARRLMELGFLPGATIFWNSSARTTNYVDNAHLTVAIPASDVLAPGTGTLSSQNPGSGTSNTINLTVQ